MGLPTDQVAAEQKKNNDLLKPLYEANTADQGRLGNYQREAGGLHDVAAIKDHGLALTDQINQRDRATGMSLGERGAAAHLNQSQIIEIARQLVDGQMTHAQEIAGLRAMMARAAAQTKAIATTK